MSQTISAKQFVQMFRDQSVNIRELQRNSEARKLGGQVNEDADSTLRKKSEYENLFALIDKQVDTDGVPGEITLRKDNGELTAAGQLVALYEQHRKGKSDFFAQDMHVFHITQWPGDRMWPDAMRDNVRPPDAKLSVFSTDPTSNMHIPGPGADGIAFATEGDFSVRTSGNLTNGTPKSSYKITFRDKQDNIAGMRSINLKSMWNDASQMREAISWDLLDQAGIHAPRHTYAKLAINDRYYGLYSAIEQVDETFLRDHFGRNDKGNLYKAYWSDLGPASLEYRKGANGNDGGSQYYKSSEMDNRTYQLKTNDNDPKANSYDDLARFVKVLNGVELPGGDEKFNTVAYKKAMEDVFDVKGFLRWASTNMLLGAWDNYYATPANYYLYNSGKKGGEDEFMEKPYFHWIPWDYDNSLGSDFFRANWQYADIVDWAKNTSNYYQGKQQAHIPLITNLLKNDEFKQYYLDHLEHMLDTSFRPDVIAQKIGQEGGDGLWERIRHAAYLESDSSTGPSHTGRQWTNDEVYRHGFGQHESWRGDAKLEGIEHYVRMRYDSAKAQLAKLRQKYPKGASGASFTGEPDPLPKARS